MGIANCGGLKTESIIKVKGISHPKGLTGNLPKWATLHIVAYIVLAVIAAKQTVPYYRFVHTGASGPCSNIGLKNAHADKRLALFEYRRENFVPIIGKGYLSQNVLFKGN